MSTQPDEPTAPIPPEGEPGHEDEDEAEADELDEPGEAEAIATHEAEAERVLTEAHGAYLLAVFDHFGVDEPVAPCPTCESRGYLLMAPAPDPNAHRCDTCRGLGITATGSLVDGNVTRPCPTCRGAGFTEAHPDLGYEPVDHPPPVASILPPSAFPAEPPPTPAPVAA